jgi:uracil-DNA glycosylase
MPENSARALPGLLAEIRACRICEAHLVDGVRPVLRASATARLCIAGQAPGLRVHKSGIPFDDPSGDRLRDWLGVDRETFYDVGLVSVIPMGFCFPGYTAAGADKPPRKECAAHWREKLFASLPDFRLTLIVGSYAAAWHLGPKRKSTMTETVLAWRDYGPRIMPLPHPSWRNSGWLKKNPWFETELLPELRRRVRKALA